MIRSLLALLRAPGIIGGLLLFRDYTPFMRLHFLAAAVESGLLSALQTPATAAELARRASIQRVDLLVALLELGVSLGELSRKSDRYALRGRRSRLLARTDGDAAAALAEHWVRYDGTVFRDLVPRLRGGPLGDYLGPMGSIIARSSRVLEPFVGPYVTDLVASRQPRRLLDVGCGSGIYLRYAAAASPDIRGVGIDLDAEVVRGARANLETWQIADRFDVLTVDVRQPPMSFGGFDLITLFNNVYYFAPEERAPLFKRLRSWLASGGALSVVILTKGRGVSVQGLDVVLRSTQGCWGLPDEAELELQLREAGFADVERQRLTFGQPLDAFIAT